LEVSTEQENNIRHESIFFMDDTAACSTLLSLAVKLKMCRTTLHDVHNTCIRCRVHASVFGNPHACEIDSVSMEVKDGCLNSFKIYDGYEKEKSGLVSEYDQLQLERRVVIIVGKLKKIYPFK
jgi:hypothetical protein